MSARDRFIAEMVAWLNARLESRGASVDAATPLFSSGIISSLQVLELIAWTEVAIGREIADREIRLDNFRTIERIAEVFVGEEGHHAAA